MRFGVELVGDNRFFDRCFFMGDLNYRLEAKKAWVEDLVSVADLMRREAVLVQGRGAKSTSVDDLAINQINLEGVSSNVFSPEELKRGLFVLNLLRGIGVCKDAPQPKEAVPIPADAQVASEAVSSAGAPTAPAVSSGPSEEEVRYVENALTRVKTNWIAANPGADSSPE